ncbi:DUF2970 domain-containing protein [Shewanella sp. Isolate11]|nr:DUF2970 domain-containing protein [Shewanella sp. Isolate11]MCG9695358.1 DUF2970 domain-containing protein [Shewanella sp. Isolate11]
MLILRPNKTASKRPSIIQLLLSTLAAFFGVQSQNNRHKDFQSTSPLPFIIMGIALAILLIISLIMIVNLVLS